MSVVIIGGHDRMVSNIRRFAGITNVRQGIYPDERQLDKQIGSPDLLVLFTNTVSHK